jgi:hypothetical protein
MQTQLLRCCRPSYLTPLSVIHTHRPSRILETSVPERKTNLINKAHYSSTLSTCSTLHQSCGQRLFPYYIILFILCEDKERSTEATEPDCSLPSGKSRSLPLDDRIPARSSSHISYLTGFPESGRVVQRAHYCYYCTTPLPRLRPPELQSSDSQLSVGSLVSPQRPAAFRSTTLRQ